MSSNEAKRRILLGVAGGIAAYKAPLLVRALTQQGAQVRVVLTAAAKHFVGTQSLQAVSGFRVRDDLWDEAAEAGMGHIELARWADTLVIAPATADVMAKLAHGIADDLLTTLALATRAERVLAPALNVAMWEHPATQRNVDILRARGAQLVGPEDGEQACGEYGPGRMAEPAVIAAAVMSLANRELLAGQHVVITAGPTFEAIDPVRFIGNRSSGRMGYAMAAAARDAGAKVTLISGPVALAAPYGVERVSVRDAKAMDAAVRATGAHDIFIAAAAVADFSPINVAAQKIKKGDSDTLTLELKRNTDILAELAQRSQADFVVGFAAETERVREHARGKLQRKGLDLIVANDVSHTGCGFDAPQNAVTVIWDDGEQQFDLQCKQALAHQLTAVIAARKAATT